VLSLAFKIILNGPSVYVSESPLPVYARAHRLLGRSYASAHLGATHRVIVSVSGRPLGITLHNCILQSASPLGSTGTFKQLRHLRRRFSCDLQLRLKGGVAVVYLVFLIVGVVAKTVIIIGDRLCVFGL
jgi:hypothetical protein